MLDQMVSILKDNSWCMNYLRPEQFVERYTSNQRCWKCQKLHFTLLHLEAKSAGCSLTGTAPLLIAPTSWVTQKSSSLALHSHIAQMGLQSSLILLMTCHVQVITPDGFTTQGKVLLYSVASTSFCFRTPSTAFVSTLFLPFCSDCLHWWHFTSLLFVVSCELLGHCSGVGW